MDTERTMTADEASHYLIEARAGSPEAFCDLVEPLQPALLRLATVLSGNTATADDLVQQTLIEAWKSLAHFNGTCRFSTWLSAILIHRHQKWLRAARCRPQPLSSLSNEEGDHGQNALDLQADLNPTPAEALLDQQRESLLRTYLDQLPEPHRQVVWLRFFEGAALQEIAAALGCSMGTVKSRLHYALEKLRQMNLSELRRDE